MIAPCRDRAGLESRTGPILRLPATGCPRLRQATPSRICPDATAPGRGCFFSGRGPVSAHEQSQLATVTQSGQKESLSLEGAIGRSRCAPVLAGPIASLVRSRSY